MKGAVHLAFPCGRCLSCRLNQSTDLASRMMGEIRYHCKNSFVTFTYNDDHLPEGSNLVKRDLQLMLKRIRKRISVGKAGVPADHKFRYVISGEYGTKNGRPHYHGIFFGLGPDFLKEFERGWTDKKGQIGFVSAYNVNRETCNYVAKYTTKKLLGESASWYKEAGVMPEFMICSRKPFGIGYQFADQFGHEFSSRGFLYSERGTKLRIPRFFKNRVTAINPIAAQRMSDLTDDYLRKKNFDAREQIVRFGYAKMDGMKLLAEEAAKNNSKGKESLKRRKL